MSVQLAAAALQKLTWPTVTGVVPASTVAVRVTTVPEVTVVTALPLDVIAMVVVVGAGVAEA
jgi:choline-glycine betaine transporter